MISILQFFIFSIIPIVLIKEKQKIYKRLTDLNGSYINRNKFCAYMIVAAIYILTMNSFYYFNVIISNLIFLPHILKNIKKNSIPHPLVSALILIQMILTLYFTAYPGNFPVHEPDYTFSFIIFAICLIQIGIMYWDKRQRDINNNENIAPLLRNQMNPEMIRKVIDEVKTCGICLNNLTNNDIIITRCSHAFHNSCLQQWISVHPICPICRNNIQKLRNR